MTSSETATIRVALDRRTTKINGKTAEFSSMWSRQAAGRGDNTRGAERIRPAFVTSTSPFEGLGRSRGNHVC
jgi:hypothetical protein